MKKSLKYAIGLLVLTGSIWSFSMQQSTARAATNGSPGGTTATCRICKKVLMGKTCKDVKEGESGTTDCKDKYEGRGVVSCTPKGKACGAPTSATGSGGVVIF